jgi:hypothetical protein
MRRTRAASRRSRRGEQTSDHHVEIQGQRRRADDQVDGARVVRVQIPPMRIDSLLPGQFVAKLKSKQYQ